MRRRRAKTLLAAAAFAMVLALALPGCSATQLADSMPSGVAEPSGTPVRPAVLYQYPAVHDMPPPRSDQPLTDEQQVQMEKDLQNARDRQEGHKVSPAANSATKPGENAVQTEK